MAKRRFQRRTVDDILFCADCLVRGLSCQQIEKIYDIPHATAHWLVVHKLENVDPYLYDAVSYILHVRRYNKKGGLA